MDKSLMLRSIKEHLEIKKDIEFANYLGIKPGTLTAWHARNTFDAELLITKCSFLNPRWLLTGEGEMLEAEVIPGVNTDSNVPASDLLDEKERYIQHLLKELEEKRKNIADLQSRLDVVTLRLDSAMEYVDILKKVEKTKNNQLKNE